MKRIITLILIFLIGILAIEGCVSSNSQIEIKQQNLESPQAKQNDQNSINNIPQPPDLPE